MRVLVIGAGGFLGGQVWQRAVATGMDVVTAGRSALPGSPRHHRADLAGDDPARIAAMLADAAPDAVLNCAGATGGSPEELAAANVTGTCALLEAMIAACPRARLVHLGSAAEYGPGEPGVPLTEGARPRPMAVYGVTKLAGTRLVELAGTAGPLDTVVLRVFNPVGPGAPEGSLPGRLAVQLRQALAGRAEVRLGPLDAVRDFVDARDVADAVLAAATVRRLPHRVLNIGSGRGVPVRELVKEMVGISGYTGPLHEDAPGSARSQAGSWQQADITRARRELGWRPQRELATAVAGLWQATR